MSDFRISCVVLLASALMWVGGLYFVYWFVKA